MSSVFVFVYGLIWGSFINVLAMRTLFGQSLLWPASSCPACKQAIHWYDNLPVASFILLRGKCRSCKAPISWLYPFIEILTGVCAVGLYWGIADPVAYAAYALFLTALLAATRTDLATMLIPQCFSLFLVPVGLVCSWFGILAITSVESLIGAVVGYGILWGIAKLFFMATKREGMGQGDMDLLAGIGAWIGPIGVWITLMIASLVGTILGCAYVFFAGKDRAIRIPFGPFLALGAVGYLFFGQHLLSWLFIN